VADDTSDTRDADDTSGGGRTVTSSKVAEVVKRVADDDEQDADWASPSRVGRILTRLRLKKADRTAKQRGWVISGASILGLARAYGIAADPPSTEPDDGREPDDEASHTDPDPDSVTCVTSVTSVTVGADERERFEL
jgi:hypothetical protein